MRDFNICLIDDDRDEHDIFKLALKGLLAHVHVTGYIDAEAALKDLADKKIKPDCFFVDLNMPRLNGQGFLMQLKKNMGTANIPVVIYTNSKRQADRKTLLDQGARFFITKPDDVNELQSSIKNILEEITRPDPVEG